MRPIRRGGGGGGLAGARPSVIPLSRKDAIIPTSLSLPSSCHVMVIPGAKSISSPAGVVVLVHGHRELKESSLSCTPEKKSSSFPCEERGSVFIEAKAASEHRLKCFLVFSFLSYIPDRDAKFALSWDKFDVCDGLV